MASLSSVFASIDNFLGKTVGNPYVLSFLMIFFIVYGAFIAPKLPPFLAILFANPLFKALFMIAILLVWNYNPQVAILVAIGFLLSIQTLYRYQLFNTVQNIGSNLVQGGVDVLRQGTTATGDFVENVGEAVGSIVSPLVGSTVSGVRSAIVNPITGAFTNRDGTPVNVDTMGVAVSNAVSNVANMVRPDVADVPCIGCNGPQPMSNNAVLPPQPFTPEQVGAVMTGCDSMGPQGMDFPTGYDGTVFGADYGNCNSEL